MKKSYWFLRSFCAILLVLCHYGSKAQLIPNYTFAQETGGTYVPITDSTMIAHGPGLSNEVYPLTLPFTFNLDNTNYTDIYVGVNGYISFGTTNPGNSYWMLASTSTGFRVISGFDADLASSTTANTDLSYKVTGFAPNRKFIVQWSNFGYNGTTIMNVNFQIILNESSNLIEMSYGNTTLGGSSSNISVQVGLRGLNNTVYFNRSGYSGTWWNTSQGSNAGASIVYQSNSNLTPGIKFKFIAPPYCEAPAQPTNLVLNPGLNNVNISYTHPAVQPSGYLVIRTPGTTPLSTFPINGTTYTSGNAIGNGTVIYAGSNASYNNTGLTQQTNYTYTIIPYKTGICIGGPTYNASGSLSGTIQTAGPKTYTWVPASGSANWTLSTNWTPERTVPLSGDTLVFNNGGTVTASNIPNQSINCLNITGNTQVTLNSNVTPIRTLTINNLMKVDTGSSVALGTDSFTVAFATTGAAKTASIYGSMTLNGFSTFKANNAVVTINAPLILNNTSQYIAASGQNQINGKLIINNDANYNATLSTTILNDSVNLYNYGKLTTVSAAGSNTFLSVNASVNVYGPGASFAKEGQSDFFANFTSGSSYNHRRDGGILPRLKMDLNSYLRMTGITTTSPQLSQTKNVGNFIWDCPGQSAAIVPTGYAIDTVLGTLSVVNTGTYPLQLTTTAVLGEFIQQNSTVKVASLKLLGNTNLISGVMDVIGVGSNQVTIAGNLNQSSSHMITCSSTSYAGGILFGGAAHQYITIGGTIGAGNINYTLNNKSGATLVGTIPVRSGNYINKGYWDGPGGFTYDAGASLNYVLDSTHYCHPQEWPAVNGPSRLEVTVDNQYPYNLLYMPSGDRSVASMYLAEGILVLGDNNLFHTGIYNSFNFNQSLASYPMIATNGTGSFFRKIGANDNMNQYYSYPVGDISGTAEFSLVQLTTQTTAGHNVGVNVKDMKHPAETSTTGYLSRYWKFIDYDSLATPITYKARFTYNPTDVYGNGGIELNRWGGSNWYEIPSSIVTSSNEPQLISYNSIPLVTTQHPLNNNVYTGRSANQYIYYTWNGSVNNEYIEPQNWTPARINRTVSDVLQFNNGQNDTVVNVPDDVIRSLRCTNNTNVVLKPAPAVNTYSTYGPELAMNSDMDETTKEFFVDSSSSVTIHATDAQFYFRLMGDSARGRVDGRFEMITTVLGRPANVIVQNPGSVFEVYGKLVNRGANSYGNFAGLDSNSFVIHGIYEHKYTISGGGLPKARWMDGSLCHISSYTTTPPTGNINGPVTELSNQYANFYKLVYDCPDQTNILEWAIPNVIVRDSFIIRSTGTGKLNLKNSYDFKVNHFRQDAGLLELTKNGTGDTITITGSFQEFGALSAPGASASSAKPMLNFAGTNGAQLVSFNDNTPSGAINYRINNPQGIQLTGTGTLANYFDVDTLGSFVIAQPISSPVTSALKIRYRENAGLTFEAQANIAPDTLIFPAANGPHNLKINVGNNNRVIMPGSRIIPREVSMQTGDIDLDTTHLTIGLNAASPGKLTYNTSTAGTMRVTTGSLTRWYGISGLPISADTGQTALGSPGFYPMSSGQHRRAVSLYFSTATALSAGGTITVSHNAQQGFTSGLSIADGAVTITDRTNASWTFASGNGITVANGSFGMMLTGGDLVAPTNPTLLRISQSNAVAGTHLASIGNNINPKARRTGLSLADLTAAPYHIAAPANVMPADFVSITDGNWNTPSTWNKNSIPTATDVVYISIGDTVMVDAAATAKVINVNKGALLNSTAGTLTADTITNKGIVWLNSGTIRLGPVGGGHSRFTNTGLLSVTAGNLNINGSLGLLQGDYENSAYTGAFSQTGGTVRIDGNAAGIIANSVGGETKILEITSWTINATGGTLTIVDPHASQWGTTMSFSGLPNRRFESGHTFIFGDGVSTDPGYAVKGFSVTGSPWFGTLIVNGSPSGAGRQVIHEGNNTTSVGGNLTINNANGSYKPYILNLYGNLTVNAGATISLFESKVTFMDDQVSTTPALVSGAGSLATNSGGFHFNVLGIANPRGLILDMGDIKVSGAFDFIKGVITMANNAVLRSLNNGSGENASQATGWINGKLLRGYNGTPWNQLLSFPVGDLTTCGAFSVVGWWVPSLGETYVRAYSIAGDHPSIAGSGIDAAKNVNRIYVIDSVDAAVAGTNFKIIPTWPNSIVDPGAAWPYFNGAKYYNNNWTIGIPAALFSNKMEITGLGNHLYGQYIVGEASGAGIITQQPSSYTTCSGTQASFSIQANMTSNYQWQVNTGSGWNALIDNNTYSGVNTNLLIIPAASPSMDGFQYRCLAGNYTDTVTSAAVTLSVNTSVAAGVTISTTSNTTLCAGTPVSFTAAPVNGGTNPVYQWKINGINTGSNNYTFTAPGLNNNDIVTCQLTSSSGCASPAVVTSNPIAFSITPLITPTLTIAVSPGTTVCGSFAAPTFTATAVNAGTNPEYQWTRNGSTVSGATAATYTPNVLNDGDDIRCYIHPVGVCSALSSVFSNIITMDVTTPINASINITSSSAMPLCAGVPATFNASVSNAGTGPSYQWKKNGNNVGTNSNSFTDATLVAGDVITCVLTIVPGAVCYNSTTVNSNAITVSTINSVTPVVNVTASTATSICAGQSVTFNATVTGGGTGPVYQWKKNGNNVGTNNAAYTSSTLVNGDIINCTVTYTNTCYLLATSNNVTMAVTTPVTPTVTIATPQTTLCNSNSATFTATPTNGGTAATYQWKKNGTNVGANSSTYTDAGLLNGDIITCVMNSSLPCLTQAAATSNAVTITITTPATPSVTISTPQSTICSAANAVFTAVAVNGGTSPVYQWKKNGSNVGSNSNTHSDASLVSGDVISCSLTSNASCVTTTSATSNNITMAVTPTVSASVSVAASQTSVCSGTSVVFTATAVNAGSTPIYQWKKNGINTGSNSTTYTDAALLNSDVITCALTSNATCVAVASVVSNSIAMTITPTVPASVLVSASQTSICPSTSVTFTANATNGGTTPVYQWKKNNINVGTNNNSYTDAALNNNDVIVCQVTSNANCVATPTVTSNEITITVNPILIPSITISAATTDLCESNPEATLNASVTNGGTAPVYQWKKNGINTGTNSSSYTDPGLVTGDVVTCELVSNATCASTTAVTSNTVTFTVNPSPSNTISETICEGQSYTFGTQVLTAAGNYTEVWSTTAGCDSTVHLNLTVSSQVTPVISISANPGTTVTNGQTVIFTATIGNGGTAPIITWKKNNVNIPGATGLTWQGIAGTNFVNGDKISAAVQSNLPCASTAFVESAKLTMVINTVGIKEHEVPENFELFPNPTTGTVTVKELKNAGKVEIRDMMGRKLHELNYQSGQRFTISLNDLAAGPYSLFFIDNKGKRWHVKVIRE
jgi:hypothetical protein